MSGVITATNLQTSNIKSATGNASITVANDGTFTTTSPTLTNIKNTSTYNSDGGAVNQNLVQGLSKSWVNLDGDAGTPAARDSLNLSSVTDSATGKGIFVVTSNFGNDDFVATAGGSTELVALNRNTTSWVNSTSQYGFVTYKTDGDAVFDFDQVLCVAHGDLA